MISDYLPLELFAKILSEAVHSDDDDGSKAFARAVLLSSVSSHWRHVVTSLPELWTHIHTHDIHPLQAALDRSNGHFQSISLDLTRIESKTTPESRNDLVVAILDLVVKHLSRKSNRWHTLSFITNTSTGFSSLSNYLDNLSLHDPTVISSITTLRLTFLPSPQDRSTTPTPRFSTSVFPNLGRVHTSNVLLSVNPSIAVKLRQPFEVHLHNWQILLDSTTILIPNSSSSSTSQNSNSNSTTTGTGTGTRHRFNYHLVIHDTLPNTYSFERLELWDVGALTIDINNINNNNPSTSSPSSSSSFSSTSPNSDSEFAHFWSKIGFPKLRYLEFCHSSSDVALARIKTLVNGTTTTTTTTTSLFPRLCCLVVKLSSSSSSSTSALATSAAAGNSSDLDGDKSEDSQLDRKQKVSLEEETVAKEKEKEEKQKLIADATKLKKAIPSLQKVMVMVQDADAIERNGVSFP